MVKRDLIKDLLVIIEAPVEERRLAMWALEMRREEISKDLLLEALGWIKTELSSQKRYAEEDVVLDMMDRVVGWCAPGQELR